MEKNIHENVIWKEIYVDNFKNYEISNLGNIKNSNTGNILKLNTKNGYKYITVQNKDRKSKSLRINRLVAIAFIPNDDPEHKTYVNHIDGNKSNNTADNLEWITPSDSIKHAVRTGLLRTQAKKIHQYDKEGNIIKTFESLAEAFKETGISDKTIWTVCQKKCKSAGGFVWRYEDETKLCKKLEPEEELFVIKDYSHYAITKTGKIYSYKRKRFLELSDLDGYSRTYLSDGKVRKGYLVHRLVAETFIPNPDNKPEINHKNKYRKDNRVENLEWVTGPENKIHAIKSKTIQENIANFRKQIDKPEKEANKEIVYNNINEEKSSPENKKSVKIVVRGKPNSNSKSKKDNKSNQFTS